MLLFLFRCALLITVSFPFFTLAAPTPFDKQEFMEELETLINYGEFEKANNNIQDKLDLTSIANDHYFKYELYLKKSLIYKSVFNYTSALDNLNYAEQHGIKDLSKKSKVISTVKVERLFIYFDLQLEEQFRILFSKITSQDIAHLSPKTKSFYNSILGILAMHENKFNEAEKIYDQAIQQLKKEDPKHLPNIYRAKVALYSALNNEAKALEAFNTGLKYAEQYQVQLYKIVMHEALTKYYVDKNDYKKALKYQTKVSELRTAYNANNVSGKLNLLDKEYEQFHKEIELEKAKKKITSLCSYRQFYCSSYFC